VALTLDWQTDGPSRATIRQGGVGFNAARLIGVPFLAGGGYLAYQFLGGVLHPGELTWAGWTLLPLMTAALLVPGSTLLAGRRRTTLESARLEVVEEIDYLVYTRRKVSRVTSDSHVMLRYEQGSNGSNRYDIHVYVDTAGQRPALIGLFSDKQKDEALAFATKAAAFLTIPMRDRLVEEGEVTSGGVVVDKVDPEDVD
jgi:hypothetical protein